MKAKRQNPRTRSNERSIRENASVLRAKVTHLLGAAILCSWGVFFARIAQAALS